MVSVISQVRRYLYRAQRTLGDLQAAQRGPRMFSKRLARRKATRRLMRSYNKLWK